MKRFVLLFAFTVLLFTGCGPSNDWWGETFNPKPSGYTSCYFTPLIKDENGTLYFQKRANNHLLKLTQNSLDKTTYKLEDKVVIDYQDEEDSLEGIINIDNHYYAIDKKVIGDDNVVSYPQSNILIYKEHKIVKMQEFIDTYYNHKIDLTDIVTDINDLMDDMQQRFLPISLYPEGIYIIYTSKTKVKFKRNYSQYKHSRGAAPGYKGYKVSHYRFYPVDNPQNPIDVEIPCKPSRY